MVLFHLFRLDAAKTLFVACPKRINVYEKVPVLKKPKKERLQLTARGLPKVIRALTGAGARASQVDGYKKAFTVVRLAYYM